jgi:hypothetical protein
MSKMLEKVIIFLIISVLALTVWQFFFTGTIYLGPYSICFDGSQGFYRCVR